MGRGQRLRSLDDRAASRFTRNQSVTSARTWGLVLFAIGAVFMLGSVLTGGDTAAAPALMFGLAGGLWLGRAGEASARRRGKGLRDG